MTNEYEDPSLSSDAPSIDPNATEPKAVEGAHGGKRPGAGRPKGSKNQFSKHSVDRLKELEFDPMEAMVDLYHETATIIAEMEDVNHPRRYSAPALAALIINKQKVINDLMRYGYRHVPEKIEVEAVEKQPFQINFTGVTPKAAVVIEQLSTVDVELQPANFDSDVGVAEAVEITPAPDEDKED